MQESDRSLNIKPGFARSRYIGAEGLKVPDKSHPLYESLKGGWITFVSPATKLAKDFRVQLIYSLSFDGSVRTTLVGLSKFFEVLKGREEEYIDAVLPKALPQDWRQEILQRAKNGALSKLPVVTFVNRLNGPRTILVGDAAHGVSPTLGSGCNMAVTDGKALDDALTAANGDVSLIPQKFNDLRHQTVQSRQLLEAGVTFAGNQFPGWIAVWCFFCQMHMMWYGLLQRVFSRQELPAVPWQVCYGQISPIKGVNIIKRDGVIASIGVAGVLFALIKLAVVPAVKYLVSRLPIV